MSLGVSENRRNHSYGAERGQTEAEIPDELLVEASRSGSVAYSLNDATAVARY